MFVCVLVKEKLNVRHVCLYIYMCNEVSGGSRIFPSRVRQFPNWDYFAIFCRKLHENERIWTPRGARVSGAPLDPPMEVPWLKYSLLPFNVFTV